MPWRRLGVALAVLVVFWAPALRLSAAGPLDPVPAEELALIERAAPARAPAQPQRPRRLLIYMGNVNYGGHPSMAHAAQAFRILGQKTGAFSTQVSTNPADFSTASLRGFDAVFLNNNVGNLFEDPVLRESLMDFIVGGGGLLAVHGSSVAFMRWPGAVEDWPEFGRVLGGRGANHRESDEHVFLKLDDPEHPVNAGFGGQAFDVRDEIFRVHEPYSRDRVRVLLSIDTQRTDMNQGPPRGDCVRADNDYAVAWLRGYGRGRSLYCTLAHNPYVFWDARLLDFYLRAAQFVLGDLGTAAVTPSGRLSPAVRAQERLGWRTGLSSDRAQPESVLDLARRARASGRSYAGVRLGQKLGDDLPGELAVDLDAAGLSRLRLKLDDHGVRLLTLKLDAVPAGLDDWRRVFRLARRLGVEAVVGEVPDPGLEGVAALAREFDVRVGLPTKDRAGVKRVQRWERTAPQLGAALEVRAARRNGADVAALARALGDQVVVVQLEAVGAAEERWLRRMAAAGVRPTQFEFAGATPQAWENFDALSQRLAAAGNDGRKP